MRLLIIIALFLGAISAFPEPKLAPLNPLEETEKTIADEYIVIFKEVASKLDVAEHMDYLNEMILGAFNDTYEILHVYDMGPKFHGYAARMSNDMLAGVRGRWEVDYVERNHYGEFADVEDEKYYSENPNFFTCKKQLLGRNNWGLSRISHERIQRGLFLTYKYNRHHQGEGVNIYIIDSGIDVNNREFGGRARWGKTIPNNVPRDIDTTGHGTKVAGIAISKTYGVAKKARAIAVKIDRLGKPTTGSVAAGINWVKNNHKPHKSVANISLNKLASAAVNQATNQLCTAGVPVVVSAGNARIDACSDYPASAADVITVASSDRNDAYAGNSNYGGCVNIIAPGVQVQTVGLRNQHPVTGSGTSFAAPYVAGVLAKILGAGNLSASEAVTTLFQSTADGIITNIPNRHTPNIFLQSICRS